MLYNVTKIYVLDNQVLYIDEGEISRNSANYNKIDVITPATGYGIGIAFELPNGVYTDEFALTQETGFVGLPDVNPLQSYQGEQWSSYTMLIPNAVLSAITSTTSQTLGFSLRFTKGVTNVEAYEDFGSFPTVGVGDKVYFDEELNDYYIWDGTAYEEKTASEADDLTVAFDQAYSTERAFLSIQGTVGGEPVALDAAFFQNQIVSKHNELVSLYNQLKSSVGDPTTGLSQKVTKSGDTMTGTLTFSAANDTRIILNNNDITMDDDAQINATSFSNGDYVSDAVKFSDLTSLFDLGSITPASGENFLTAYSNALESKFNQYIKSIDLGQTVVLTDGTSTMTGNLDMGGKSITNVLNVDGVDVSSLSSVVSGLSSAVQGLQGSFVFRGIVNNTTAEVDADKTLLTTRLDVLLERQPQTGDVLKDTDGGEWYYDGTDWRFMGQGIIDTTLLATKQELSDGLLEKIDLDGDNSALTVLNFVTENDTANITYNEDKQVLEVSTPDGTTLNVGGELWFVNAIASETISNGDVVMFSGVLGDSMTVAVATTAGIAFEPELFVGIATHDAQVDEYVKITWFGEVSGIDTSAFSAGDKLYFDNVNGGLTATEPTTKPIIQIAAVIKSNATDGKLLVRPKFVSRKAAEVFVAEILDNEENVKINSDNLQATLEALYDKTQAHEDASNPHGITPSGIGAAPTTHSHAISDVTDLQNALDSKPTIDNATGKIPVSVIPFQFDDVLQGYYNTNGDQLFYQEDTFENVIQANEGKLYVDISTNDIYRYDGTVYVLVKEAVGALGDIPNVTLTNEANDDVLKYNGSNWVNGKIDINELEDVVITGVSEGEYLKWDSDAIDVGVGAWVNTTLDAPVIDSLNAIDDVDATTPNAGDILQYNATTSKWEKNRINFVSDTAPTSPNEGDLWFDSSTLVLYVYYNDGDSTQWVNAVSGIVEGQPEELNDLTDVTVTTPANGEVLSYNNSTQVFENKKIVDYYTTTIDTTDWSGTDPVTTVKTVSGVLSTDKPLIDIDLSSVAFANVETTQTEYAKLYRVAATADDQITFYALETPTENLTIQIKVVR